MRAGVGRAAAAAAEPLFGDISTTSPWGWAVSFFPEKRREGDAVLPEKRLNHFVHFVAMMERFGNALGTLAFTWATVVLIGGYSKDLFTDFYVATVMIFLEAVRMFSRNNRMDYQCFFRTRGAFRSRGWNALILLLCFSNVLISIGFIWGTDGGIMVIPSLWIILLMIGPTLCPEAVVRPTMCGPLSRMISLWSPMVAILLILPSVLFRVTDYSIRPVGFKISVDTLTVYLVLFAVMLLLTVSRLRFPTIIKLVDSTLGSKTVFWRRVIMNVCMFAAMVMSVFGFHGELIGINIRFDIIVLMTTSFGNLQIPAAILRIGMALWGLRVLPQDLFFPAKEPDKANNLVPSLNIYYAMVLGQGLLYIVAGILEIFSFILRRSLIRRAGFSGPSGVQYVNLYYTHAFNKCMEGAVLSPQKTSLVTFAMDSLKSDSPKMQLYGLKMLHNFLKTEPLNTKAKSELTTSTKTVTCLVNMLGWTSEGDKDLRSFAATVTSEIADNLRVVSIPGTMHLIASLLHNVHVDKMKDPLLDIGSPEPKQDKPIEQVSENEHNSGIFKWLKQMAVYCLIPRDEPTNMDEQKPNILRCCWKWCVPEEEPSTYADLLPVLGMLILDKLATFDLENCIEISKSVDLISKIIEFTSIQTDMTNINEIQQTKLKSSSLKLLRTLSSTKGKFGVTLRQKISEDHFLLSNLAEILDDSGSSQELQELTIELLRNLAMDRIVKEEIGHIPVIISKLMHAFLSPDAPSTTKPDQLLSGQALAILTMDSANNCLAMLAEKGDVFIKELTYMIKDDRYRYVASSLLRNICVHAPSKLGNSNPKEISSVQSKVLEGIMDAEGAELEVLVGLSSQICHAIPDDFARALEHDQTKENFIERLVNVLNSNRTPTAHYPGIRRVIIEHAIYMMECNPGYTNCFTEFQMMAALLEVERKPSRADNYKFLGDAGLMKHPIPMSVVVSKAKKLMSRE